VSTEWFDLVSGSATGAKATLARAGLRALSVPFAAAAGLRRWLYRRGVLASRRAPVPVISVGNITVGGTGKTPLVEYLARGLIERDRKPGIVSRGYKACPGSSGDEASMLRGDLGADVAVVEDPVRHRGCLRAVEEFAADVIVLDDGFQHLALERDVDIVTVDATNAFGFGRLLPAGCLREPPRELRRADCVVVTRTDLVPAADITGLRGRLVEIAPDVLVVESTYAPRQLVGRDGEAREASDLDGARVAAFCGIGNPYAFGMTLRRQGAEVVLARRFADHHDFTRDEILSVFEEARSRSADMVVTTQKDMTRITPALMDGVDGPPLFVLRARFRVRSGEKELWGLIGRALKAPRSGRS